MESQLSIHKRCEELFKRIHELIVPHGFTIRDNGRAILLDGKRGYKFQNDNDKYFEFNDRFKYSLIQFYNNADNTLELKESTLNTILKSAKSGIIKCRKDL